MEMNLDMDASLPEVLEEFTRFLRAVGYQVDGELELIDEKESYTN